jgi:RNA polymerase sigma-70 factor, ECF subfamily
MGHGPTLKDEDAVLEAARSGDPEAFEQLIAKHRPSLHAHSYRMLGSVHDADDALQEALIRAWRGIPRFEGRTSVGGWLYRIATNTCYDVIAGRRRRMLPAAHRAPAGLAYRPTEAQVGGDNASPEASCEQREAAELAFIVALRHLPSRQRAALILRDVLGLTAREVAEVLSSTPAAVNSALQRARAGLERRDAEPSPQSALRAVREPHLADIVERLVDALEQGDLEAMVESLSASGR